MSYLIIVFGVLLLFTGLLLVSRPEAILGLLRTNVDSPVIHFLAVAVRLVLGAALVVYSAESRFPVALEVLGWITLAAAIGLAVMGRRNFELLMRWALNLASSYGRIAGIVALLFGAFLVYAVL